MSTTLEPRQIVDYALTICPAPVGIAPLDAHATEWRKDVHHNPDPIVRAIRNDAYVVDDRLARQIKILLLDDSGQQRQLVFSAYDFLDVPAAMPAALQVQTFRPGPWCQRLETLALQVAAQRRAREDDRGGDVVHSSEEA